VHKDQHLTQTTFTTQQHVLIWVVGIVLCMFAGLLTFKIVLSYAQEDFQAKAELVYEEIARRYSTLEAVLTSLAGFHQASDNVSEVQFSTFAQELLSAYPYIRSAVSLHKLDHTGRTDFEEEMRDRGYFQFSVTDSTADGSLIKAAQRPEYLIINIIEPLLPHMGSLLGYNVLSDPDLAYAVTNATRTGSGVASSVSNLLNRDGGIMVFKAVYQGRYAPTSEQERRAMFNGAIAMEVGAESLLSNAVQDTTQLKVSLNQKRTGVEHYFEYTYSNGNETGKKPSILPVLNYKRDLNLYGQATELNITRQVNIADMHYFWILFIVLSCLIIYIAIISTWHNMKTNRIRQLELKGYAARAAFSEENTDPIMRIDHGGRLLYSNDPGMKIIDDWKTAIGDYVPKNIKEFVNNVLQHKQYQEIEVSVGTTHYTLRFVPRSARKYVNVYGRDDTEQKQAEMDLLEAKQAAEAANIAKSRFLATISHEVRTPMNGILGMLELLLNTQLTERQHSFAENAIRSGKNLLSLINDILDFSKIESNNLKLEQVDFNLKDTIEEVIQIVSEEARSKNLNLLTDIPDMDYQLIGDVHRLRQILINLVGNAVKFTEKGDVLVRVEKISQDESDIYFKIEIRDTGIGITPEALPYIFDDFTQQDDSTTRRFGGTGLGLAITKQLINMMGGEIDVQSMPGQGSSFCITLRLQPKIPELNTETEQAHTTPGTDQALAGEIILNSRVLLAEDNMINQEVASAMLESAGCEVVAVNDGQLALQALKDNNFDLVLMDCQMPTMDGFEATRRIRQQASDYSLIPVIALTADIQEGIMEQCREAGMNDYLSKPFTHDSLLAIVMKWLPEQTYREVQSNP
jgi:signal transduction histidine kinase/ActR/RegA family two-component response regulator/CHASE1-domain containing sensor protein